MKRMMTSRQGWRGPYQLSLRSTSTRSPVR
jgi:hypothetical protein